MALKNNTWKLNQWYDQDVAGNATYSGATETWVTGKGGMAGQNNNTKYSSPVQVPGTTWGGPSSLANIKLSAGIGETFRMWLKSDGTIWGAGGGAGKLGQNNNTSYSSPKQLGSGTDWRSLASSWAMTVASKTDGTLWSWGENSAGSLGQNNLTVYSSPKQIPGNSWSQWIATSSNQNATMAIKTDGTLWAWGYNLYGELGQNTASNRYSSPVQVGSDTTWGNPVDMASKSIIKSDGTLWVWGINQYGQLGLNEGTDGTSGSRSSPTQVPGTTWSRISRGSNIQLAIKTDGTMWAWGYNGSSGALAQNDRTDRSSPTQIPGTTWKSVVTDYLSVIATKTDGTLWSWGDAGNDGGLGHNNRQVDYSSPVQLPGTTWRDVGAVNTNGITVYKEL